jgi:iron complex outermembrane receptor protein
MRQVRSERQRPTPPREVRKSRALHHDSTAGLRLFAVVCLSLIGSGLALPAQPSSSNPLKHLSLEQLGNIEVTTVSKEPDEVWHTPAAIYVITAEEIRRSGYLTLPEILRLAPGVEVQQIDSNKWAVGIRGFDSRLSKNVLVLIDGRSVYTPLFRGVYWEMQDVFIEDIDRIEVIRGPGGTIWGSNAVNGVINIITENAKDTQGILVSAGGGNVEQGFVNARYGGSTGNFSYRMYGKAFTRGPQFHTDGRNFDDWRRQQFGFRSDWGITAKDTLTIEGDIYHSDVGNKLGVSYFNPPSLVNIEQTIDLSGGDIVGNWRHRINDKSELQVLAYYDHTYRNDINFRESRDTFDVDFNYHWKPNRNNVILGAGVHVSPSTFTQVVPTVDFEPPKQTYSIYSGFLQDEITLLPDKLSLQVGTKLENNSFSGFDFQPSGRLLWTPGKQQSFWAAVTRAVRTPSRIEDNFQFSALAVPALPLYLRLIGDGNFVPETMLGYEVGYRQFFKPKVYVDVATYYNEYNHLLSVENFAPFVETTPAPTHLVLPIYLRNGLRGETYGFEIAPAVQLASWWQLKGSYSFLHLDVRRLPWSDDASSVAQLEGSSPTSMVKIQSYLNLPRNFEFDVTYRYSSKLPSPDLKIAAYSTANARLGWRFHKKFDLSFVGENLFQQHHAEYSGDPGGPVLIRRGAYAKITFTR